MSLLLAPRGNDTGSHLPVCPALVSGSDSVLGHGLETRGFAESAVEDGRPLRGEDGGAVSAGRSAV